MICDICQGQKYPIQCRGNQLWRQAYKVPELCPYGDLLTQVVQAIVEPRKAAQQAPLATPMAWDCKWARRQSCCRIECTNEATKDLPSRVFPNAHCSGTNCKFYEVN